VQAPGSVIETTQEDARQMRITPDRLDHGTDRDDRRAFPPAV